MADKITKLDFAKKNEKKVEEKVNSAPSSLEILTESDVNQICKLSDEDLEKLTSNLTLNDNEGRNIIFSNEDEAIIYAAQLQMNIPEIRFCEINKCFSIYTGKFWTIKPMGTEYFKNMKVEDYQSSKDFVLCSALTLAAIAERAKRNRKS